YDTVDLRIAGVGENVWLTIDSPVVGTDTVQKSKLPATFPTTFHFTSAGFYEVPLTIQYDRNNKTITQLLSLGLRVEEAPLRVLNEIRVPSDGLLNLSLQLELPEKIFSGTVTLASSCLEGGVSKHIENFKSGVVSLYVKGTCDPGLYSVNVSVGDFQTSLPLTVYGPEGFETFTNTFVKDGKHTLEIILANEGSQTMKAVSVRLLPGDYQLIREGTFIGDLSFGDFDSAELVFIPNKQDVELQYNLSYTLGGEKITVTRVHSYHFEPARSSTGTYAIVAVLLLGVWYVKRRKSSH
ncbi:MAG: hypothetical protein GOV01_03990, partial [Candidatus Altiarchaeota archaeon]|nr:hypothetical protein [Candidatus Altiarchaeota archaeon]